MIKRNNKKGFTIVELVIVIAVIAILAAVLIPTFAGIIKKANLSADQQAVRQMNVALATASAEKAPANIDDATKILVDAGYNADKTLVPVTSNHSFYWYETYNLIVLVNEKDSSVVFPTDNDDVIANFAADKAAGKLHNLKVARSKTEASADSFADVLKKGNNVTLTEALNVAKPTEKFEHNGKAAFVATVVPDGETVSIDLGEKTLKSETNDTYALGVAGEVYIDNGTISSRGIYVYPGAKLVLGENVKVEASGDNGGSSIRNYGGVIIVNGGEYSVADAKTLDSVTNETVKDQPQAVFCDGGYLEINGGTFNGNDTLAYVVYAASATVVINDCTLTAERGALNFFNSSVTINGGNFTNNYATSGYALYYEASGSNYSLTVNGGTFTNTAGGHVACIVVDENVNVSISESVLTKTSESGSNVYYKSAK